MLSQSYITLEDKNRRRQLTDFAVKLSVLAGVMALTVEVLYYLLALSPEQRASDAGLQLLIVVTILALGLLATILAVNRLKFVPYWVGSTVFLLALIFLTLFSNTPQQLLDGRSTMFFLVPILLSGVLVHSYATFIFTTLVTIIFVVFVTVDPGAHLNPLNIAFFYMLSGLVSKVLRDLEISTYKLCRESTQSQTILSALRGGYILTDDRYRILRLNERSASIFPLARLNSNLLDVIPAGNPEISDDDQKRLTDVITGVEVEEVTVKISGKHYYATDRYIPANKEHLIFLRDITAEVEIDRLKDTALAMVSHELRTPLTAIRGHAELAMRQPYTAVANATRILLNTQRLLIMVENLLSQARLRTGKVKNIPTSTSIETVFRVVYSLLLSEAREKQLEFVMEIDQSIPAVMVDAVLLQQILTNLTSNAIKFTTTGRVTMAASMPDEAHWTISVTDTGSGIPVSKRSEIFTEFFQGETQTVYDRPHQGTGIGLSIVKGLTEQMGGKLAVQSEESVGSSFLITFPLIIPKEITRTRKKNG